MPPLEIIAAAALTVFIVILVIYRSSEHRKKMRHLETRLRERPDRFDDENLR